MSADQLVSLVGSGPLLLDFDGPVCGVFAGLPAPQVAAELVELLRAQRVALPNDLATEADPLAVMRWVGYHCSHDETTAVEDALTALELRAVATATPTPFGHETILAVRAAGLPVAIVSNNSSEAVSAYLAAHGLSNYIDHIFGRPYSRPELMKPNPMMILAAVRALHSQAARCVLVGDSLTDIEAARVAGVRVVGYANQPSKVVRFGIADAVVTSMADVARALSRAKNRPSN
ncbi:HAD family hydrolase [Spirilliplanes yamanashiensis]|uniref:Hydrolase n=1 Tax=Spirilliplanes yamanashiensis TaxID=42233 RepID=A0A8J3YDS6_9ACTN|nr:HAD-IA family hydrolase [Spirilliplanes yamanashiensis]MDP9815152.1 HAD superfamily hydrolase (TIGR01509 family) [Spirilliplanes yamanashiensis]MDP9815166.1 HAD superfamily hydrolase (TIGR01509 family) [Spirilliplanes yamanashiensis]GIJ06783.1 hydrolase [Spirilliplanes yamanashiensis]